MRRLSLLISAFDPPTLRLAEAAGGSDACLCVLKDGDCVCSFEHRFAMAALVAKETGARLLNTALVPSKAGVAAAVKEAEKMYPGAEVTLVAGDEAAAMLLGDTGAAETCRKSRREALNMLRSSGDAETLLPVPVVFYIAVNDLYLESEAPELAETLSESRLLHTLSVRDTAIGLAERHCLPILPARKAAMLHDCVKCMPYQEMLRLAKEAGITDPELLSSPALLHAPLGAWYAKEHFGVSDRRVLDAISTHTLGAPGMTALQMCILVADMIEPRRRMFPALPLLRRLAEKSLPEAALACLEETEKYVLSAGGNYSEKSRAAIEYLAKMVNRPQLSRTSGPS